MLPKGTPVVVTDPDIQDIYNAILSEDWDENGSRNPLVSIQTIIRYPIQTAVLFDETPNENAPLREGQRCRLKVLSIRSTTETMQNYEESLKRAWLLAYEHAKQKGRLDCLEILERHGKGEFTRKRSVCET